jgi:hypothetical protein
MDMCFVSLVAHPFLELVKHRLDELRLPLRRAVEVNLQQAVQRLVQQRRARPVRCPRGHVIHTVLVEPKDVTEAFLQDPNGKVNLRQQPQRVELAGGALDGRGLERDAGA